MYYRVYGSGDKGSEELCRTMVAKGVPFVYFDIRGQDAKTHKRPDLEFLLRQHLTTVPQVFDAYNNHVGGYDEMMLRMGIETPPLEAA